MIDKELTRQLLDMARVLISERGIRGVRVTRSTPNQHGVEVVWMRGRQLQYIEEHDELRDFLLMISGVQRWGVELAGDEDEESLQSEELDPVYEVDK